MSWPQYVYLALILIGIGSAMARYGEEKKRDRYDIVDVLIAPAIITTLLWVGGFFEGGAKWP